MTTEVLLHLLEDLVEDDFEKFKWHLQQNDSLEGHPPIPKGKLEKAMTQDTVDLMVQTYTPPGAVEVTQQVLKKINRNDLVQSLSDSSSGPEGQSQEEKHKSEKLDVTPVYEMHYVIIQQQVHISSSFPASRQSTCEEKQAAV